jgi:hypothetical protein
LCSGLSTPTFSASSTRTARASSRATSSATVAIYYDGTPKYQLSLVGGNVGLHAEAGQGCELPGQEVVGAQTVGQPHRPEGGRQR